MIRSCLISPRHFAMQSEVLMTNASDERNPSHQGTLMSHSWFKPVGWFYRPVSWQGVVLTGLSILFCVHVFGAIDRHSHSATDTLYGVFPYFACCFLLLNWVASNTSRSDGD